MASEIKTLPEFKAELLLELKQLLEKSVAPRLKTLEAGYSELKDLSQVKKRVAELERNALLRTDVGKDQEGRLHLKESSSGRPAGQP